MKYEDIYKEGYLPPNIEWKPIIGYENMYEVSNYGHVKRLYRVNIDSLGKQHTYTEKIFYPKLIKNIKHPEEEYYTRVNYGMHRELTHRLVARHFLVNPNNYPEVNHKNGKLKFLSFAGTKENNYTDGNLEWCNREQNMQHASKNGLLNLDSNKRKEAIRRNQKLSIEKNEKSVEMFTLKLEKIAEFKSIKIAGQITGIPQQNIGQVCMNKRKTAGGFVWKYKLATN